MFNPVKSLVLILLTGACGPKVDVNEPTAGDGDGPPQTFEQQELERIYAEKPDADRPLPVKTVTPAPVETARANMVTRADLDAMLDGGVGRFLGYMEVAPHLNVRQQFIGWEIVKLKNRSRVDIRPGDVVTSVNRKKIERPNQVKKIWDDLRHANAIYVAGQRAGKPFTLRIDVVQDTAGRQVRDEEELVIE